MNKVVKVILVFVALLGISAAYATENLDEVIEEAVLEASTQASEQEGPAVLGNIPQQVIDKIKRELPSCTKIVNLGVIAFSSSARVESVSTLIAAQQGQEVIFYEYEYSISATGLLWTTSTSSSLHRLVPLEWDNISAGELAQFKGVKLLEKKLKRMSGLTYVRRYEIRFDVGHIEEIKFQGIEIK